MHDVTSKTTAPWLSYKLSSYIKNYCEIDIDGEEIFSEFLWRKAC